jgi:methenyltetrahydromethanopterin cyclohydrolase
MDERLIAQCGVVDLETGEFQYGNIYGFWGDNTTYEVYQTDDGKNRFEVVATAGLEPIVPVGGKSRFFENMNNTVAFTGEVIETVTGDDGLKSLIKYGKELSISTYK